MPPPSAQPKEKRDRALNYFPPRQTAQRCSTPPPPLAHPTPPPMHTQVPAGRARRADLGACQVLVRGPGGRRRRAKGAEALEGGEGYLAVRARV